MESETELYAMIFQGSKLYGSLAKEIVTGLLIIIIERDSSQNVLELIQIMQTVDWSFLGLMTHVGMIVLQVGRTIPS